MSPAVPGRRRRTPAPADPARGAGPLQRRRPLTRLTRPAACVRIETCVVVLCADCGEDGHREGIPHYDDLPAARASLDGWDWTDRPDRGARAVW